LTSPSHGFPEKAALIYQLGQDMALWSNVAAPAIDQTFSLDVPASSQTLQRGLKIEPPIDDLTAFEYLPHSMTIKQSSQIDPSKAELDFADTLRAESDMQAAIEEAANAQAWIDMVLGESSDVPEFAISLKDPVFVNANQSAVDRIFPV